MKLGDFGLSRIMGEESVFIKTRVGTPYYMSPEQGRTDQDLDFRTDVYSLGCTLFHLLTGRVPFEAENPMAVLAAHQTEPVPSPGEYVSGLQRSTIDLVMMMMAKDPADRFDSWTEVLDNLKICIRNAKAPTRKNVPVSTVTNRIKRPRPGPSQHSQNHGEETVDYPVPEEEEEE